ncbi:molecular chaperone [Pseudomonas sp.]|uniref:fimbrial biogenesis chaperone n=1 Tax=Pseudomonas sp. TaxID=306 RepID=UPI002638C6D4|nr:molecular chaperone [Pseudomonas sp.]
MSFLVMGAVVALGNVGAQAAVSLSGTRLIFDGRFREVSIEAINRSSHEVLLQAWLSDAQDLDGGSSGDLPFVVTPHLWHLQAHGRQVLRVLYEGIGMPIDQESLLHLYVMEVPPRVEGENQLSIAIRQRINVFYRPSGLPGDPARTAEALVWRFILDEQGAIALQVSNPTAYHASLQNLRLEGTEENYSVSNYQLLPPGVTRSLPLTAIEPGKDRWHRLSFKALNDFGGQHGYVADVDQRAVFSARSLPDATLFKDAQP